MFYSGLKHGMLLSGMQTQLRLSDGDEAWSTWHVICHKVETGSKCTERKVSNQIQWNVQRVINESTGLHTSPKRTWLLV